MMVASNQLRSAQSEATLVLLMEKELEERRKQTEKLRSYAILLSLEKSLQSDSNFADLLCSKCKEIASGIRALKGL